MPLYKLNCTKLIIWVPLEFAQHKYIPIQSINTSPGAIYIIVLPS